MFRLLQPNLAFLLIYSSALHITKQVTLLDGESKLKYLLKGYLHSQLTQTQHSSTTWNNSNTIPK